MNVAVTEEVEHARSAGLRYVDDRAPGLRRERTRSGFAYFDAHGKPITDEDELTRIRSLAIPPAYENVWIRPYPHRHVQATARDAKGRKQYRYHKHWHAYAMPTSTNRRSPLRRCYRGCASESKRISQSSLCRARKFSRPSCLCCR